MAINTTILAVMRETNNFFLQRDARGNFIAERGEFALENGSISLSGSYQVRQYILLTGSTLVDGVYRITAASNGAYALEGAEVSERWSGVVYSLRIPPDFTALCEEIHVFSVSKAGQPSDYASETVIGVHSYTRGTKPNGAPVTWRDVFMDRLHKFRRPRIKSEVEV